MKLLKAALVILTLTAVNPLPPEATVIDAVTIMATKVAKPSGFTVTKQSYTSALLNWNANPDAVSYRVYRSTKKSSGYKLIATVTEPTYTDNALVPGKTYYYRVRTYTAKSKSAYSSIKKIKITVAKPVLNDPVFDEDNVKMTVSWDQLEGVTGYELYASNVKNKNYKKIADVTEASYTYPVTNNKTYYYKVRAYVTVNGKKYYSSYSAIKSKMAWIDYVKRLSQNNVVVSVDNPAKVRSEVKDIIVAFENTWFQSTRDLNVNNKVSLLFTDPNGYRATMSDLAIDSLIKVRKQADKDLSYKDVEVSLTLKRVSYNKKTKVYKVFVLETARYHFNFMPDVLTTEQNVEHNFYVKFENGHATLNEVYKEMGNYLFLHKRSKTTKNYKTELPKLADLYVTYMLDKQMQNKQSKFKAETTPYTPTAVKHVYNRDKAVEYANKWALDRNTSKFRKGTSNCMNFVSQCLNASGIPFDTEGSGSTQTWKSSTSSSTASWVSISAFKSYVRNNKDRKLILKIDENLYYAEKGDLIFCGSSATTTSHVVIITDIVKDANGNISEILINGNTNDQQNFPLSAFTYPFYQLGKIDGYN